MSDVVTPQETDEEAAFRAQFDPRQFVNSSYTRDGKLEHIDFDFRGPVTQGTPTIKGVAAKINRIIMYFSSTAGDYHRSSRGNEFSFVYNAPASQGTQFRILSTAQSIMRRKFSDFLIEDLNVDRITGSTRRGWNIRMTLRHRNVEGKIELDMPLSDDERLRLEENIVTITN